MSPPERELRKKLKELRDHITKNADYVGPRFPEQARKIHYGETEHRSIYGEASPDEAKELHEEGIEFHPLPMLPDEFNSDANSSTRRLDIRVREERGQRLSAANISVLTEGSSGGEFSPAATRFA